MGLGRGFLMCTICFFICAQNGENRLSGLEPVCFRPKQFAGDCSRIVRKLCKLCRIVQICVALCFCKTNDEVSWVKWGFFCSVNGFLHR